MDGIAVIGGGPAGSTIAALLAQRGLSVRLYEATRFPRPHIGESLLPATIEALELSGAAQKVRSAGFTVKNGATMAWGADHELWTWNFRETNKAQPHSYQVNREEFDQILLQHARESGVHVHEGTKVQCVRFDGDDAIGIEIDSELYPASYVIDATGQQSLIANQEAAKSWDDDFRNLAVYRYYRGGEHMPGDAAGNILVESVADGWLWKIPLKNHVSSVGVVTDRDIAMNSIRETSLEDWFDEVIRFSTYTSSFLTDAEAIGSCTATRDWSYQANQFTGPRHCLIGDAACFIDPLFSTGVHLAIYSATIGAALVATTLNAPNLASLAAEAFERQYRQHYGHFRELARLFYGSNRSIDSYFWQTRQITGESAYSPRAAFVRAVSGQASTGYERTTLSHGVLPHSFTNAIDEVENSRHQRQSALRQLTESTVLAVSGSVSIENVALFSDDAFQPGLVIRRKGLDDIPISRFVADVISVIQSDATTASAIASALTHRGWTLPVIRASLKPTIELLCVEGIFEFDAL
ncbi:MAG: NAD(P)/FAD-dependent oxidoreductase [Gammaproteobacteria bacterium]|nr:NAD(P)/FAD-dependent oxidoreductase [Gammaproteobacteria bacterium]